jgi:hypothetical protein
MVFKFLYLFNIKINKMKGIIIFLIFSILVVVGYQSYYFYISKESLNKSKNDPKYKSFPNNGETSTVQLTCPTGYKIKVDKAFYSANNASNKCSSNDPSCLRDMDVTPYYQGQCDNKGNCTVNVPATGIWNDGTKICSNPPACGYYSHGVYECVI